MNTARRLLPIDDHYLQINLSRSHPNRRVAKLLELSGLLEPARRMRILLIAEMCNPEWTSVPLVGYNFAQALAQHRDIRVDLVTHVRNRAAMSRFPIPELQRVIYIDNEIVAKPMHLLSRFLRGRNKPAWTLDTASQWPSYMMFERELHRRLSRELESGEYDLIHRVTPLSPTIPSPLARKTNIPMVLGPLNGGLPWPSQYPGLREREGDWLESARFLHKLLPYYRSSYARLAGVISGSQHTRSEISPSFRGLHFYLPENGVDLSLFRPRPVKAVPDKPFRFISVGRLVPYKGFDLVLEAMAGSEALRETELVLIGEGPERGRLTELIATLELGDRVQLLGWQSQSQINEEFAKANTFVFPSLREFGGGVVLEAMAAGLPSIIVNYGGPAELQAPESSILLPMCGRDEMILRLREAMLRIQSDSAMRKKMGNSAIRRAREQFSWPAKADRLVQFYRETIADYSERRA